MIRNVRCCLYLATLLLNSNDFHTLFVKIQQFVEFDSFYFVYNNNNKFKTQIVKLYSRAHEHFGTGFVRISSLNSELLKQNKKKLLL